MQTVLVNLSNYGQETVLMENSGNNLLSIEFMPGEDNDITSLSVQGIINTNPTLTVNFVNECVPDNAVYLRWINIHGGYEYAMFSSRTTNTLRTSNLEVFRPYISDYSNSNGLQNVLNRYAENIITIGIYQVPLYEYRRLLGLLIAPDVDIYDPISKQWVEGIVINQTNNFDTNIPLADFEIDISLNERQLQVFGRL